MQMNQINLDINKSGQIINEPVVLRVGDKDQTITVNLLKDGLPYTSFTTATFFANKPSGAIVANDPANISSGTITYTVPQALVNEFGKITNAYFLIDGKVSTESFVIAVLQGVKISDDLSDYIPGMGQLNVIYDKWKAKLQTITDELAGIDAPKEVKNVIDNELKNYTDQINELQRRITAAETQLDALKVPEIGGVNLLKNTTADVKTVSDWNNHSYKGPISDLGLSVGNPIIYSAFLDNTDSKITKGSSYVVVSFYDADAQKLTQTNGNHINHGKSGTSFAFARIPDLAVTLDLVEWTDNQERNTAVGKRMLERGTVPTDWTPAPEDMVTVSDINDWQKKYTAREDTQDNAIIAAQSTANGKFDTNQAESYLKSITALPETFANLEAIKAKYPSGKNGLMVAADNGHKYIWANSTWTDAGVYQAVGIADGSVGWAKRTPIGSQAQVQYFGTGKINFDFENKLITIPKETTIVVGKNPIQIGSDITTAIPITGAIKFFVLTVSLQGTNFKCYTSSIINKMSESEVVIAVCNYIAQTVEMNGDYLINGVDKGVDKGVDTDNRIEDLEIYASEIKDNADGLIPVTVSNNLVDKSIIKFGGYYDYTNGTWKDRADINSTGFISCKPQDTFFASASGNYVGGNVTFWNKKGEYVSGIDVSVDKGATTFTVPGNDDIASFKMSFIAVVTDSYIINKGTDILPYDEYKLEHVYNEDISSPNIKLIEEDLQEIKTPQNTLGLTLQSLNSIGDISTTQYRSENYKTTFWLTKINRDTFNGGKIKPKVRLTSSSVDSRDRKSVLDYITNHDTLCCINAGVFDVTTGIGDGRLIIDGAIQKDSAPVIHQNQWTLGIKSDGSLSAYDSTISASTMLQDGCESAVTGFVPIIMNGSMVDKSLFLTFDHLTQPNPRQVICQTVSGDYFVFSCDGRTDGEEGLTLEQIGNILLSFGVTFAYNLDGGGSTQTFVKKRRINRLIENRPVPSIIVFEQIG